MFAVGRQLPRNTAGAALNVNFVFLSLVDGRWIFVTNEDLIGKSALVSSEKHQVRQKNILSR